jgi:hypothetical protein
LLELDLIFAAGLIGFPRHFLAKAPICDIFLSRWLKPTAMMYYFIAVRFSGRLKEYSTKALAK